MRRITTLAAILVPVWLAGCAAAPDPSSLDYDPFEDQNRQVHAFNKSVDSTVFGGTARAWGVVMPQPVRTGVGNLNDHWSLPGETIQYALQGKGGQVARHATRFAVNSTFGLFGLLDPAAEMGLPYDETNFDETFHVWGVPEGGYVEVPFGGPGTQRDWTGWALDIVADPMFYVAPVAAANALVGVAALDIVNDRYELDPVLEELLYTSQDSYTAQRITYLQNMRARLQGGSSVEQLEDVYADF